MPRKKVVKSAARKKQPSKQANKTPANTLTRIEAEFSETPARLADQYKKEIAALQQKENKLNTTLAKIAAQAKKIEKAIAAAKKPSSSAAKKQLLAAKKALNDTKKDYALSNVALKETTNAIASAERGLAKAAALAKHLKAFEKDWNKQAKELKNKAKASASAKSKTKSKAKTRRISRSEKGVAPSSQPALTVVEQAPHDSYDDSDDSQLDDAKQAV